MFLENNNIASNTTQQKYSQFHFLIVLLVSGNRSGFLEVVKSSTFGGHKSLARFLCILVTLCIQKMHSGYQLGETFLPSTILSFGQNLKKNFVCKKADVSLLKVYLLPSFYNFCPFL